MLATVSPSNDKTTVRTKVPNPSLRVRTAMVCVLLVIAVTSGVCGWKHYNTFEQVECFGELLSLAGKQRSHSQYISRIITELSQPNGSIVFNSQSLQSRIHTIKSDRARIRELLGVLPSNSSVDDIKNRIVSSQRIQQVLIDSALEWHECHSLQQDATALLHLTQRNAEESYQAMESLVSSILEYHKTWIGNSEKTIASTQVVMLAVLGLCFILVVNPCVRYFKEQYSKVCDKQLSYERLAMVAETISSAVVITDSLERIVWVNDGFTRLTGYTLDETVGRRPGELLQCERTSQETVKAIRHAVKQLEPCHFEIVNRAKNGVEYWSDLSIQPIRDEHGVHTGYIAIQSDVTESVTSRLNQQELSERLSLAVNGSNVGLWDSQFDDDGNEWWSPKLYELLEYDPSEIKPGLNSLIDLIHPDSRERIFKALEKAFVERSTFDEQFLLRTKSGEYRWFLARAKVFVNEDNISTRFAGSLKDIHDRQVAKENLENSTHFFQSILDSLAAQIAILDENGFIIESNKSWKKHSEANSDIGLKLDMGVNYINAWQKTNAIDELTVDKCVSGIKQIIARETQFFAIEYSVGDGPEKRWLVTSFSRSTINGKLRVVVSQEDITQLKQVQEERHSLEERLSFAIEGAGDGVWDWDITTGYVLYSKSWCEMLGYDQRDIPPNLEGWSKTIHPDDLPTAIKMVEEYFEGMHSLYVQEYRMLCKDGSYKWILSRGKIVSRDPSGKALRMVGTHTDISERKRYEIEALHNAQLLVSSNVALEEAQALGKIGSWSYDLKTHSMEWSKQTWRMLTGDESTGQASLEAMLASHLPEDAEKLRNAFEEVKNTGKAFSFVLRINSIDGIRYLHSEGRAHYETVNTIDRIYGTMADVTIDVEREESLRLAREEAESSSRSKSEFLANMSHEIRTPMTAIMGFADLLIEDGQCINDADTRFEYVATIKRNGEHLLSIINDILDISKIEAGKMEVEMIEMSPNAIIQDVVSMMHAKAAEKNVRLKVDIQNELPEVIESDPVRLRQILINLLGNAIKFTDEGNVTLQASFQNGDPGSIKFTVIDTGIGMSNRQLERLFAAFEQADASTTRKYGGSGLGLRISKRLAEMLGGTITVESKLGQGSKFIATVATGSAVFFVRSDAKTEIRHEVVPTASVSNKSSIDGIRILLAEDGIDNQRLISHHLRKAGAIVTVVDNGKLAVEWLSEQDSLDGQLKNPLPIDLLISDMQMPEMDGYTACKLLREKGFDLPIIALTANAMRGDAEKCINAGCDIHLPKPINRLDLIRECARLAEVGSTLHSKKHNVITASSTNLVFEKTHQKEESDMPSSSGKPTLVSEFYDDPDMQELVEEYLLSLTNQVNSLSIYLSENRLDLLGRLSHQIRGSGGSYGFPVISKAAEKAELLIKQNADPNAIHESILELVSICKSALPNKCSQEEVANNL